MNIGEVSREFGLPISTLRYYDKEGLLLNIERNDSGTRIFNSQSLEAIRVIECLKKSGLKIAEIKHFMYLCSSGDSTIEERKEMFLSQRKNIEEKIDELNRALDLIEFKCWYYSKAVEDGTEKHVKTTYLKDMPPEIRKAYENAHNTYLKV